MAFDPKLTITGIQETMARDNRRIANLSPEGAAGEAVRDMAIALHRHAVQLTHVDTGALRASHRMQVDDLEGMIFIDPDSRNPRSRQRPVIYGVFEHERGGEHAFYDLTLEQIGEAVKQRAIAHIQESVIYGK